MQLITILQDLGLNDKESRLYLGLLEIGPAKAGEIAQKTNIKRTTIYETIKSLRAKNLVVVTLRKNTKIFVPRSPEYVADLWKQKIESFEIALPEFKALELKGESQPKVTFLEGKEEIKHFYKNVLEEYKNKSYDVIGNTETFLEWDPKFFDEYRKLRANAKIKTRLALTQEQASIEQKKSEKTLLNEIKFFPKEYQFTDLIRIYPGKILFQSKAHTNIGIVVESREFVDSFKKIFEYVWGTLK